MHFRSEPGTGFFIIRRAAAPSGVMTASRGTFLCDGRLRSTCEPPAGCIVKSIRSSSPTVPSRPCHSLPMSSCKPGTGYSAKTPATAGHVMPWVAMATPWCPFPSGTMYWMSVLWRLLGRQSCCPARPHTSTPWVACLICHSAWPWSSGHNATSAGSSRMTTTANSTSTTNPSPLFRACSTTPPCSMWAVSVKP